MVEVNVGEKGTRLAAEVANVHEVEAREAADDPLDLARCPATCLRSSGYE